MSTGAALDPAPAAPRSALPVAAAAFERLAGPRRADVYRVAGRDLLCRTGQ